LSRIATAQSSAREVLRRLHICRKSLITGFSSRSCMERGPRGLFSITRFKQLVRELTRRQRRDPPPPFCFEEGSAFLARLSAGLGDIPHKIKPLLWSGENSTYERDKTAHVLADHLSTEHAAHPQATQLVIAHSHGGNIALRALHHLYQRDASCRRAASSNRATWTADHLPPRAAGMPCSSSPAAMARSDSKPAACSSWTMGARSDARARAFSCRESSGAASCYPRSAPHAAAAALASKGLCSLDIVA
jgi:hypothetical protein